MTIARSETALVARADFNRDLSKMRQADGLRGKRVLVVEDEFLVALDLECELADSGAEVTCASTLGQATGVAQSGRFDAVVLDLNLHGETSYPLADYLAANDVPFVFHTGQGEQSVLAKRYPGVAVCNKPCDGRILLKTLECAMSDRSPSAANNA